MNILANSIGPTDSLPTNQLIYGQRIDRLNQLTNRFIGNESIDLMTMNRSAESFDPMDSSTDLAVRFNN